VLKSYFFLFFFILSPYLTFNGTIIHTGLFAFIFLLIDNFNNLNFKIIEYKVNILFIFLFLLLSILVYGFIRNFQIETIFINIIINICVYLIFSDILLSNQYFRSSNTKSFDFLLNIIVNIFLINSLIVILEFYFPWLKYFFESIMINETNNIAYLNSELRFRGFSSSGGSTLSIAHGASLLILTYFLVKRKIKIFNFILKFSIIFFSLLLIGRTGIVLTLIGIITLLIFSFFTYKKIRFYILKLFLLFILFFSLILGLLYQYLDPIIINYAIDFMFEGKDGFSDEGTTTAVLNFYKLPNNLLDFVFGNGTYNGSFSINSYSDAGYMRSFTLLGYPIAICIYIFYLSLFISKFQKTQYRFLIYTLLIITFISEIKEPSIFTGNLSRILILLLSLPTSK
jgi:hypothetical protein